MTQAAILAATPLTAAAAAAEVAESTGRTIRVSYMLIESVASNQSNLLRSFRNWHDSLFARSIAHVTQDVHY